MKEFIKKLTERLEEASIPVHDGMAITDDSVKFPTRMLDTVKDSLAKIKRSQIKKEAKQI